MFQTISSRSVFQNAQWLPPPLRPPRFHSIRKFDPEKKLFVEAVDGSKRVIGLRAYLKHLGEDGVSLKVRSAKQDCPALLNWPVENLDSDVKVGSIDVTTLGNLCVDIVLNVPSLPPSSLQERYEYMENLANLAPDQRFWEGGGNCNFAIAAARLGLCCFTLGHVGDEKYGRFLHHVLEKEGVQLIGIGGKDVVDIQQGNFMFETLLCWVLVDSERQHGFCSRFDFNKEPVFSWVNKLPGRAEAVIRQSKVLFLNGFVFDELPPSVICSSVELANNSGSAVFFDPGPRGKLLAHGTCAQRQTLGKLLSMSDVLLLTLDEAEALTGMANPILSSQALLDRGQCTKWVVIKMGEKGCLMATVHGLYRVPAFKVDVVDTVGCGDSFAAAVVLGYNQGLPPTTTLALANAVGAATAMGCGAGRNVATMDRVIEILLGSELLIQPDDTKELSSSRKQLGTVEMTIVSNGARDHLDYPFLTVPIQLVTKEVLNLLKQSQ